MKLGQYKYHLNTFLLRKTEYHQRVAEDASKKPSKNANYLSES